MEKDIKIILSAVFIMLISMAVFELDLTGKVTATLNKATVAKSGSTPSQNQQQVSAEYLKCTDSCVKTKIEKKCYTTRSWYRKRTYCNDEPVKYTDSICMANCSNTSNTQLTSALRQTATTPSRGQPPKPGQGTQPSTTANPIEPTSPTTTLPQNQQQVPAEYQKCIDSCTKTKIEKTDCRTYRRRSGFRMRTYEYCNEKQVKYIDPLCVSDCNKKYLPDLTVTSANFIDNNGNSIANSNLNDLAKPLVVIKNIGTLKANNFKLKIEIIKDNVVKRTEISPTIYTLNSGESKTIYFSANYNLAETGTYNIRATVDNENLVRESNENNNLLMTVVGTGSIIVSQVCTSDWQCSDWSACTTDGKQTRLCKDSKNCGNLNGIPSEQQSCTYNLPDLIVEKAEFVDKNGAIITSSSVGSFVKGKVFFKNQGPVEANYIQGYSEIKKDNNPVVSLYYPFNLNYLPGEVKILTSTSEFRLNFTGKYCLNSFIDYTNKITESDENNNALLGSGCITVI